MKKYKLPLLTLVCALVMGSCDNLADLDKEYNPVRLDSDESYFSGYLRQGDQVSDTKVVIHYEKGLGRDAIAYVLAADGLYGDSINVKLAEGNGQVEIPVKGTPAKGGTDQITLKAFIATDTHNVYNEFKVTAVKDILLYGSESTYEGNFVINEPVTDGIVRLSYNTTKAYEIEISASEVEGIEIPETALMLPAAPDGGTVALKVSGTPATYGEYTLEVRLVKGADEYTDNVKIYVKGEVGFDTDASYLKGDIVRGEEITDQSVMVAYHINGTSDLTFNISMDESDGLYVPEYVQLLQVSGTGFVEVHLAGIPKVSGVKVLNINFEKDDIIYAAEIPVFIDVKDGVPFVQETITWNGLIYKTIHLDVNFDGFVDDGEVWLDRNIGATSNDPGAYGSSNPASFGHYYQYGVPYGSGFVDPFTIDYDAMTPWAICPDGYRLPTRVQFAQAANVAVPGSTISADNLRVTVPDGNVMQALQNSPFKLPAVGSWVADVPQNVDASGFYWTTDKGSDTAPWRIEFGTGATSGQNWSGWNWQHPVRCMKIIE